MTPPSPSASGSSSMPTQNPPPGLWAAPWGAGRARQVVLRAPSPAPALSPFAGQVVGLYSRFDVIVSTLCVCTPWPQAWPLACHWWGAHTCLCPFKPTPRAVTCMCQCRSAPCIPRARCPPVCWHNGVRGHLGALSRATSPAAPGSPEDLQQPGHERAGGAAAAHCVPGGGPHLLPPRNHGGHH